jgi:regulation of enolase protein 1 (concanavalin A-like superfamily)
MPIRGRPGGIVTTVHTQVMDWSSGSWTHPPAAVEPQEDGSLLVEAVEGSDAWRHTAYDMVHESEHALLAPLRAGQAIEVDFLVDYHEQFDQAGLFVKASADQWIKAGVEYADGSPQLGAVVTQGRSDWSVASVPGWAGRIVTVRASRMRDAIVIRARAEQGPSQLVRVAPFTHGGEVSAGPYCCSPTRGGLRVAFQQWRVGAADESLH